MINSKDLLEILSGLLAENEENPIVFGHGIITEQQIAFDKDALEKNKSKIANILKELDIGENSYASSETKLEDAKTWIEHQTSKGFDSQEILENLDDPEVLLACSDACGFIINDNQTIQKNISKMGDASSHLTSQFGKRFRDGINDEWLGMIREVAVKKMDFLTNIDKINRYANSEKTLSSQPLSK